MTKEFELLKHIQQANLTEQELVDIYFKHKSSYRVLYNLIQHPRFLERFALNIIPDLFSMDLVRVIKNKRTRPYIRKRAELEFMGRYQKLALGEKVSYIKVAPLSLMDYFIEEKEIRIIEVMLVNPQCTEDLIMKIINRKNERSGFYEAIDATDWYKRPRVASMIALDKQAPIKILIKIIPYLVKKDLISLAKNKETHNIVKNNILLYLKKNKSKI